MTDQTRQEDSLAWIEKLPTPEMKEEWAEAFANMMTDEKVPQIKSETIKVELKVLKVYLDMTHSRWKELSPTMMKTTFKCVHQCYSHLLKSRKNPKFISATLSRIQEKKSVREFLDNSGKSSL